MHYKRLILFVFGLVLLSTGTAFAANPSWFAKAQEYIKDRCGKRIITNETGLLCYVFTQVQDHNAALTKLEASQSALLSTVNNLQTNSGKSLHVIDASNQDLGIYMKDDQSFVTVFIPSLSRRMTIEYFSGEPQDRNSVFYSSTDCSGTPHIFVSDNKNYALSFVTVSAPGKAFAIKSGAQPIQLTEHSYYGKNNDTQQFGCYTATGSGNFSTWYEAEAVQLPFTLPAARPLSFKYF